jgi:hypothetical protein
MAVASEQLPQETVEARATQGRSEIEKLLDLADPPPRVSLGTTGYLEPPSFEPEEMDEGWWVRLEGDAAHLKALATLSAGDAFEILQRAGDHYLRARTFDSLGDAGDVRRRAADLLRAANGALSLQTGIRLPVEVDQVVLVAPSGEKKHFVEVETSIRLVASLERKVIRADGTVEEVEGQPTEENAQRWLKLAASDELVERALRLFGRGEPSWGTLYSVFEVVQSSVGGRMFEHDWVTKTEVKRFTHTANSPGALGDEARHGTESTEPPQVPMSLGEARELIDRLLTRWLEDRPQNER